MSHYAKVLNGEVVTVIVAESDFFKNFVDNSPGQWRQTSYNTFANTHINGGTPLRGNYAGVGDVYDVVHDVFYKQQPYPSWTLNKSTWTWSAPTDCPTDGKMYQWNESTKSWVVTN